LGQHSKVGNCEKKKTRKSQAGGEKKDHPRSANIGVMHRTTREGGAPLGEGTILGQPTKYSLWKKRRDNKNLAGKGVANQKKKKRVLMKKTKG